MKNEVWVDVPNYPAYKVSNMGRFKIVNYRKTGKSRIMKTALDQDGYFLIGFVKDGKQKVFRAHRIVATCFIPNPEGFPEVNHKKGIKTDNRATELEWVTTSQNVQHAFDTGLKSMKKGGSCSWAKLSEADVLAIRAAAANGAKQRDLAVKYNVVFQSISSVVRRKSWQHL